MQVKKKFLCTLVELLDKIFWSNFSNIKGCTWIIELGHDIYWFALNMVLVVNFLKQHWKFRMK